jgi:hypothetical protein
MSVLEKLALTWPSAIVARSEVSKFSGGLINPRSLANMASLGLGPANRFRVGRKIAYPVDSLVAWLESRSSEVD